MTELVEHQKAKISELEAENENLLSLLEAERIMVEKLQRMLFGKKSEKKEIPVDPNQLTIGFEKLDILEEEKRAT